MSKKRYYKQVYLQLYQIVFGLLVVLLLNSCSGVIKIPNNINNTNSFCNHQTNYNYSEEELAKPIFKVEIDQSLNNIFSFRALNVANAINILNDLKEHLKLREAYLKSQTIENRLDLMELSQTINNKINIASLEISSAASELDCEEERTSQIANYIKGKEAQRENNLVIGSIIVGAAGSIATEALSSENNNAGTVAALSTSLVGTALGVMMLVNKRKVIFHHKRNTLGEIWYQLPVSTTLPPSIWYYLNYKDNSKNKQSLRDLLVERWLNFGQIEHSEKNTKNTGIYFGEGGKYTAEQLKNRAAMYDEIEANITIMKQDLKQLSIEFENIRTPKK
ncbi:MAG: hypothetical protein LC134_09720 [Chitinophagales bacterium]|nr:hypothetical protein [Chitinophagales bacterium]